MAVSFPTFYGHHDENARDFMDSLEMAHLMAGRDQEEVKLRAFPLVLKGEARVWYDALAPPSKATWPALYGAFLNKYGQGDTPENLWKQLLRHRQSSLGDYNTYESKFTNLWERWAASLQGQGGAPNFLKRDKFVEGMFPTLKEKVEAKFPQTFEEAQEIATVKFKKLLYQERKSNCVKEREEVNVPQHTNNAQPRVASVSADSHQEDLLHKLTQQLETLTLNLVQAPTRGQQPRDDARPLRRSTQELRCWNCNETGHGMYHCPHPRRISGDMKATGKAGGGLVLHDSNDGEVVMKKHVNFPNSTSNNEAEYDILLYGLQVCVSQKIRHIMVKGDVLLLVKQILGIWACKNERLRKKVQAIRRLFNQFEEVQLYHISRKQNEVADLLAQKAVACNESEVQVMLAATAIKQPRYQGMESLAPIVSYILEGKFPQSFTKAQKQRLMEKASSYLFLEGALYQRGKDQVCRRMPTKEEIPSILEGLHEEACGGHFAQELTAKNIFLAGFGTPLEIVSDNGPGFRKGLLTEVCDELHVLHWHSTPYYPQSNNLVEKANGIIAGTIRKMVKNKTKLWDDFLDGALWAYQTTYKEATGFTPFHLVYGQEALHPIELNIPTIRLHGKVAQGEQEAWTDRLLTLAKLEWKREAAYECYKSRSTQVKDKLNKKVKDKVIKEGDLVLRYDNCLDNCFDVKFNTRWQGLYIVKKAFNSSYYELMDLDGKEHFNSSYYELMDLNGKEHSKKVNEYRLKPYLICILPKDLQEYQSATLPYSVLVSFTVLFSVYGLVFRFCILVRGLLLVRVQTRNPDLAVFGYWLVLSLVRDSSSGFMCLVRDRSSVSGLVRRTRTAVLFLDWLEEPGQQFYFWTGFGPLAGTQDSAIQDPHIAASDSSSDFAVMEGYLMQQHHESSSQDMHALGQQPGVSMFSCLKETLSRSTRSEHATNEINEGGGEVDSPLTSQIDPVLSKSVHVSTPTTTPIGLSKLTPSETLMPDDRSLAEVQEVERYILMVGILLKCKRWNAISLQLGKRKSKAYARLNNVEQHWQKLL
ncbi:hypothetical protein L7F22_028932 [Adiantum nelumboides]|nr:hypothetical protein [Adiantum nelumboides]